MSESVVFRGNPEFGPAKDAMKKLGLLAPVYHEHPEASFWGSGSSALEPTEAGKRAGLQTTRGPCEGAWPGEPDELKSLSGPPIRRFLAERERIQRQKRAMEAHAREERAAAAKVRIRLTELARFGRLHLGAE